MFNIHKQGQAARLVVPAKATPVGGRWRPEVQRNAHGSQCALSAKMKPVGGGPSGMKAAQRPLSRQGVIAVSGQGKGTSKEVENFQPA